MRLVSFLSLAVLSLCIASQLLLSKTFASAIIDYRWAALQFITTTNALYLSAVAYKQRTSLADVLEDVKMPYYPIFVISILDLLHSTCLILSLAVLPGTMTVLLPQLLVPLTALLGYCSRQNDDQIYRSRYAFGCVLIACGVAVEIFAQVLWFRPCPQPPATTQFFSLVANTFLLLVSTLCAAAAASFRRELLSTHSVPEALLSCIVSVSQCTLGFMLCPVFVWIQHASVGLPAGNHNSLADAAAQLVGAFHRVFLGAVESDVPEVFRWLPLTGVALFLLAAFTARVLLGRLLSEAVAPPSSSLSDSSSFSAVSSAAIISSLGEAMQSVQSGHRSRQPSVRYEPSPASEKQRLLSASVSGSKAHAREQAARLTTPPLSSYGSTGARSAGAPPFNDRQLDQVRVLSRLAVAEASVQLVSVAAVIACTLVFCLLPAHLPYIAPRNPIAGGPTPQPTPAPFHFTLPHRRHPSGPFEPHYSGPKEEQSPPLSIAPPIPVATSLPLQLPLTADMAMQPVVPAEMFARARVARAAEAASSEQRATMRPPPHATDADWIESMHSHGQRKHVLGSELASAGRDPLDGSPARDHPQPPPYSAGGSAPDGDNRRKRTEMLSELHSFECISFGSSVKLADVSALVLVVIGLLICMYSELSNRVLSYWNSVTFGVASTSAASQAHTMAELCGAGSLAVWLVSRHAVPLDPGSALEARRRLSSENARNSSDIATGGRQRQNSETTGGRARQMSEHSLDAVSVAADSKPSNAPQHQWGINVWAAIMSSSPPAPAEPEAQKSNSSFKPAAAAKQ